MIWTNDAKEKKALPNSTPKLRTFLTQHHPWIVNVKRPLIYLLLAVLPAILTLSLIHILLHSSLSRFVPASWNDIVDYWRTAYSFSEVGWNSGFYAPNEKVAAAPFSRFGVHGPYFAVIYGSLGHIFGWTFYTGLIINFVFIAIGIYLFLWLIHPDRKQLLFFSALLLTSWSLLMYLPTISQEAMHQTSACVLAALFYHLLSNREKKLPLYIIILSMIGLFLISLIRVSWAILFLPFFALIFPDHWRWKVISIGLCGSITLLIIKINQWLTPPTLNSIFKVMQGFSSSLTEGISRLQDFIFDNYYWIAEDAWAISSIILYITLFLILIIISEFVIYRVNKKTLVGLNLSPEEKLFHLINLIPLCLSVFIMYPIGGAGRVVGAHLFLSVLLLISFKRYRILTLYLFLCLLSTPLFVNNYIRDYLENFTYYKPQEYLQWRDKVSEQITYQPQAETPWCNTVLIPLSFYDQRVLVIPAGFGLAYFMPQMDFEMPPKSHYLYFNNQALEKLNKLGELKLELIIKLPIGKIYRNLDSKCISASPP